MNKKIISILLIFSLLAVSLSSISANDTNVDEQNIADMQTDSSNVEETIANEENNTTDENTTENNTDKTGPDIIAPSDPKDLQKFNILMNFVTPEGLDYFADQLAQIDETTYKDVITALRSNDREGLLDSLAVLNQEKIDVFFDEFLKLFDSNYEQKNNQPTDIISNTVSQIFGSTQSSDSNIPANNYIKVNPKNNDNQPSQNNQQFSYDGKYYSIIDFISLLKSLYEDGNITSAEFLQALEDNGIDTSDIQIEDGIINWGYLHIIPLEDDTTLNDTNSTTENETVNTTTEETSTDNSNSADSNSADSSSERSNSQESTVSNA